MAKKIQKLSHNSVRVFKTFRSIVVLYNLNPM